LSFAVGSSGSISLALSVSLASSAVGGTTAAVIDDSDVEARGALLLDAVSAGTVDVTSVAVSASGSFDGTLALSGAGAGSAATNVITATTEAAIRNSSTVGSETQSARAAG